MPCVATTASVWLYLSCMMPGEILRIVGSYQMHRRQQRLQALIERPRGDDGGRGADSPLATADAVAASRGGGGGAGGGAGAAAARFPPTDNDTIGFSSWDASSPITSQAHGPSAATARAHSALAPVPPATPTGGAQSRGRVSADVSAVARSRRSVGTATVASRASSTYHIAAGGLLSRASAWLDRAIDRAPPLSRPRVQLAVMSLAITMYITAFSVRIAVASSHGSLLATACRFNLGDLAFFGATVSATMALLSWCALRMLPFRDALMMRDQQLGLLAVTSPLVAWFFVGKVN